MTNEYTLYGTRFSLYTAKARAYLRCKQINHKEVLSTLKVYKEIIIPQTSVKMIPVVKTPDNQYLQDTCVIIDHIQQHHPETSILPETPRQKMVSYLLELYADEWLLLPAMHYRWNHDNTPKIYEDFGLVVAPKMPAFVRRFVGKKIGNRFKGLVPLLGITKNTSAEVENWFENDILNSLEDHLSQHEFLLGSRPSLADIAFMGPLAGHINYDPAPQKILATRAPQVVAWIKRMEHSNLQQGEYFAKDHIPPNLFPILLRLFSDFWPLLLDTVKKLEKWADEHPGDAIPRSVEQHSFTIGSANEKRAILSFQQWKLQRVLDCYSRFNTEDRASVDNFLKELGIDATLSIPISRRVDRKNNRLVFTH